MKKGNELKPNYAPVYAAAMYPGLAGICHKYGYALAAHGSLARDLDLVAIPWTPKVRSHRAVLRAILKTYAVRLVGDPGRKPHGRVAYTLACGFGHCSIDLSFFPVTRRKGNP